MKYFIILLTIITLASCIRNKPEPIPPDQNNIFFQKDSLGWRIVTEVYGKEKGEGIARYSKYMDSTILLKTWLAYMTDKKKSIDAQYWQREWKQYDELLLRLTKKDYNTIRGLNPKQQSSNF